MSDKLFVSKVDDVYNCIRCSDAGITQELNEYFTFKVPGYQFMPKYKNKMWDGNYRLYNYMSGYIYAGVLHHVQKFARERDYEIEYDFSCAAENLSMHEAMEFFDKLVKKGKINIEPREYQLKSLVDAVRYKRLLFHSAVNSGKSFIMYMIMRWYLERTLIIVPRTQLVNQLYTDFEDYGFDVESYVHKLPGNKENPDNKPVVITTWQTAKNMPKEWFKQFKVVFGDEAHNFKANELKGIMENCTHAPYRFGFSGSLDETKTHILVIEGLFGPIKTIIRSKEMMEKGYSAKTDINIIILEHTDENKKSLSTTTAKLDKKKAYKAEKDYLTQYDKRNNFIKNLALSLKGNTLILVEWRNHMKALIDKLDDGERSVFTIHGDVDVETREEHRKKIDSMDDAYLIATFGAFQEGSNVKKIHNIILGSPSKSYIRIIQSIGRGQRMDELGSDLNVYDIADDLTWNRKMNMTLRHLIERVDIYDREEFDYKTYTVKLK